MTEKILIVDDDAKIIDLVKAYLEQEGYRTIPANDGKTALRIAREEHPDLVILDLMLPEIGGFEVCKTLRSESKTPIIMLTARDEETDKVIGLELGADDYVTKPFSTRELVARVKAVLRRTGGEPAPEDKLMIGNLVIYFERYEVRRGSEAIDLTPTEFRLPQSPQFNQDFYQQMYEYCHGSGGMMGGYGNSNKNQGFQGMGFVPQRGMMY